MNRRSFLASILAAGVAPAAIGSGILMPPRKIITPETTAALFGGSIGKYDGIRLVNPTEIVTFECWYAHEGRMHQLLADVPLHALKPEDTIRLFNIPPGATLYQGPTQMPGGALRYDIIQT